MLVGMAAGIIYAIVGFRGQGNPPRLACTCGPFKEGMLYYRDTHIHHWMIYAPISLVALLLRVWDIAAFCTIMTMQGLSYSDALEIQEEIDPESLDPVT